MKEKAFLRGWESDVINRMLEKCMKGTKEGLELALKRSYNMNEKGS